PSGETWAKRSGDSSFPSRFWFATTSPNFMVDPKTLQCTGLIDLGRLGTADRYADLALMIANAEENWAAPDEAERAFAVLFNVLGIEAPDRERLAFYLRLDPLTWG